MQTSGLPPDQNVRNRILSHLPAEEFASLFAALERVDLASGTVIHAAGAIIDFVYFVESGFISVVAVLEDGAPLEIGIIGTEGMVGGAVAMGVERSFGESMVQQAGEALRLPAALLLEHTERSGPLRTQVLHYVHASHIQVVQTAICNVRHGLEQRLARWLLTAHDRGASDQFLLTQEFLSMMLGAGRSTVSVAAGALHKAGLIEYSRGRVTILDRARLEEAACECYAVVTAEYRRLLD